MAYLLNKIGDFTFISLEGKVDPPVAQAIVIDSRPGVDGMEFTFTGRKSFPFSLVSLVDCDDLVQADLFILAYKASISDNVVDVTQDGVPLIFGNFRCKVLNVTPLRRDRITTAVGNKQSNQAGALLQCRWDLIAVPL